MNHKTKSGLFFGIFILICLIAKGLLTENNFTAINVIGIIVVSLIVSILGGFMYGYFIGKFQKKRGKNIKETT